MNRDALIQLMAGYGAPDAFGAAPYQNDIPRPPRTSEVPPAWLPPGMQPPQGQPGLPDARMQQAPTWWRLNPAQNWRDIQT